MVNRARIEFSRSRTACNRGRLESMPEVQRVIDENLDAVERVWHGSGFAIDSLVGFALMKWLWNQQLVRPRYPVSMNAYALPRCSFTTVDIRATPPPFFSHPCSRPELNRHRTSPHPRFHPYSASHLVPPILTPIFSFRSCSCIDSTHVASDYTAARENIWTRMWKHFTGMSHACYSKLLRISLEPRRNTIITILLDEANLKICTCYMPFIANI